MEAEVKEEVVAIELDAGFASANPARVEELEERLDALGLGEVAGTMSLGGLSVVVLFDVAQTHATLTEALVVPRVTELLAELGLSELATAKRAEDAEDRDDEEGDEGDGEEGEEGDDAEDQAEEPDEAPPED